MKEKIEQLYVINRNIEVLIHILEGYFSKDQLINFGTIAEQIDCYENEGEDFTRIFDAIIDEHGGEPCPFDESEDPF
jgi:hypothetical protein